ncbi:MAG: hypothetical protein DI551_03905 [Micavibrio aeruginosavorus]|uniref:Uncharacterized protein n=1 Tax=Micavibrio aeruginosavorus TaxID=349221 RepID=A0A2W5N8I3_9BACT|nr:MAG: hypothetical protein DI551_03905 [Micavibrio aeruginosavorus]
MGKKKRPKQPFNQQSQKPLLSTYASKKRKQLQGLHRTVNDMAVEPVREKFDTVAKMTEENPFAVHQKPKKHNESRSYDHNQSGRRYDR